MRKNNNPSKAMFLGLAISLFLFVASCKEKEIPSPVTIAEEFVNQQIKIRVASYANTFKNSDSISLELKYNSTNAITFPNNYNLKIFEFSNDQWTEIQEKPTERFPIGDIVLAPDKMLPAVEVVVLFPDIKDVSSFHKLRIYVIGEMQTDNGNQNVAAYTDIELSP